MPTDELYTSNPPIDPITGYTEDELREIWEDIEASYWIDINKSEPMEL